MSVLPLADPNGRVHLAFDTARASFCLEPRGALTPPLTDANTASCPACLELAPLLIRKRPLAEGARWSRLATAATSAGLTAETALLATLTVEAQRLELPPAGAATGSQGVLSDGELDTLRILSLGGNIQTAAERLATSPAAVRSRLRQCRRKLGARSTTHAVALAIRQGLINSPAGRRKVA